MVMVSTCPTPAAQGSCALLPPMAAISQPSCGVLSPHVASARFYSAVWGAEMLCVVYESGVAGLWELLLGVFFFSLYLPPLHLPCMNPAVPHLPPCFPAGQGGTSVLKQDRNECPRSMSLHKRWLWSCVCVPCCHGQTPLPHLSPRSSQRDRHLQTMWLLVTAPTLGRHKGLLVGLFTPTEKPPMPPMSGCSDREQTSLEMPIIHLAVLRNAWQPREAAGHAGRCASVGPPCWLQPGQVVSSPSPQMANFCSFPT